MGGRWDATPSELWENRKSVQPIRPDLRLFGVSWSEMDNPLLFDFKRENSVCAYSVERVVRLNLSDKWLAEIKASYGLALPIGADVCVVSNRKSEEIDEALCLPFQSGRRIHKNDSLIEVCGYWYEVNCRRGINPNLSRWRDVASWPDALLRSPTRSEASFDVKSAACNLNNFALDLVIGTRRYGQPLQAGFDDLREVHQVRRDDAQWCMHIDLFADRLQLCRDSGYTEDQKQACKASHLALLTVLDRKVNRDRTTERDASSALLRRARFC